MISAPKTPVQSEKSKTQVPQTTQVQIRTNFDRVLPRSYTTYSYTERRELRKHPAYALARELMPGPILAANWSIAGSKLWEDVNGKKADKQWINLVRQDMEAIRDDLLTTSIRGMMDFGWTAFEQVFKQDEKGSFRLTKLKNLLVDYTDIRVKLNGSFDGFLQNAWNGQARKNDYKKVTIPRYKSLLLALGVEGTNWYGEGRLDAAAPIIESWDDAEAGAARYDSKVAGSHWVIYYPPGKTQRDGAEVDNFTIAESLLSNVESAGGFIIPSTVSAEIEEMGEANMGWRIEALSDMQARQHSFVTRLEYLDKSIVRCAGYPERAILEGNFGTKAESGVHANIAGAAQDLLHRYIVAQVNENIVDQLLFWNFGPEAVGSVRILPAPITNVSQEFLNDVYKMMMNNQVLVGKEYSSLNMPALRDKVAIPHNGEQEELEGTSVPEPGMEKNVSDPLLEEGGKL